MHLSTLRADLTILSRLLPCASRSQELVHGTMKPSTLNTPRQVNAVEPGSSQQVVVAARPKQLIKSPKEIRLGRKTAIMGQGFHCSLLCGGQERGPHFHVQPLPSLVS